MHDYVIIMPASPPEWILRENKGLVNKQTFKERLFYSFEEFLNREGD